jgi:GntR family transcriptional repressor for pyruvate dehydrogenase complex
MPHRRAGRAKDISSRNGRKPGRSVRAPGKPAPKNSSARDGALLRPIEKVSLNEQILHRLKLFLHQQRFAAGAKLPSERKLAEMLQVSRPSIREALKALSILGIVEPRRGEGTFVKSSLKRKLIPRDDPGNFRDSLDLAELAEARLAIEPFVASITAARASRSDLRRMREHLDAMRENLHDRPRFLHHDLQFHLRIIDACGNSVLKKVLSTVLESLFADAAHIARNFADLPRIHDFHERIFAAIRNHDSKGARLAMIRHMSWQKSLSLKLQDLNTGERPNSGQLESGKASRKTRRDIPPG